MTLTTRPVATSRNNPCPVCEKTDGACRVLPDETVFCHTFADAKKFEKFNGYVCVAIGKGHTATFKADNTAEWTEDRRREWESKKVARQESVSLEAQIRQDRALSTDDRHRLYSEILSQLQLDTKSFADLQRRGFSEQEINNCGFKSVVKGQRLQAKIDNRLPGVENGGRSLLIGGDGYLCPLLDFEGRIVGMQLRLHTPDSDGGRYRWLSSRHQTLAIFPENENPLGVLHPSGQPQGICLIEGANSKSFLTNQRLDFLMIGSPGGQWLSSPRLLEKHITQAIDKYGDLPIYFCPDAGWALNRQVRDKLLATLDWLRDKFGKSDIRVLDWNQIDKSQGDIDEISDLSIVRKLKADLFLKKYKEVFGNQENGGKGFASKRFQTWAHNRIKLTADIVQHEKWLSIPKGIQNDCDILLIRKGLGGGKTQELIEFLKPLDTVALLVGYRNSLLNNTIARANEMGLSSKHVKDMIEVIDKNYIDFSYDDSIKLWAGCADSFFKFNAITNRDSSYFLIHDEICSVLGHLKGGGTLKGRQKQAIEWDVKTIKNSQFAVMMDANLSDREVNFIRELFPDKRIKVLDSVSSINPRTFYFLETESNVKGFTTSPKFLPSQLVEKAKKANRVLWISDSQRSCEIIDEILSEGGHKHFRLDGKTSHDELSKQLQATPKQFILTEKLDSLSISPSGESGLSIDLYDYFDAVCFDIRGTVGVNTLTQLSARLRDTKVPIYVACPEFVNMTTDPCPYAIKSVGEVLNQRIEMLLAKALEVDNELVDSQFVADMFADMGKQFADDAWFIESLKDSKQLKYEHQNLKLTLKTALAQAGNRIIDLVENADEEQYDECQEVKERVKIREAEKVFGSEDITWEQSQELGKKDVDYDTKCKIRKARLKNKLPGIEETGSWNADLVYSVDVHETKFLDARWRLKQLQSTELSNATFKLEKKYNFETGSFIALDAWKATSTKIEALKRLGVTKLIDADVFSSKDSWVQELVHQYYDNPEWFNLIGISKAKRSAKSSKYIKEMVDRFLNYFGLEAREANKSGGTRFYVVGTPAAFEPYILDIDDCLNARAENAITEAKEISLKGVVDEAEKVLRQQQEVERRHKAEVEKQTATNCQPTDRFGTTSHTILINQVELVPITDTQITPDTQQKYQSTDRFGTTSHTILINQVELVPTTNTQNIQDTEDKEPTQQMIEDAVILLSGCDTIELLADLRKYSPISPKAFRKAARRLQSSHYNQVMEWVLELNQEDEKQIL